MRSCSSTRRPRGGCRAPHLAHRDGGITAPVSTSVPASSPRAIRAALRADATVVRVDGRVRVEAVAIDDRLRSLVGDADLYRVTIEGRYLPRALRYVVRAGETPAAYGFPRRDEGALIAVTADTAVLTERISVKYGSTRGRPGDARRDDSDATRARGVGRRDTGPLRRDLRLL